MFCTVHLNECIEYRVPNGTLTPYTPVVVTGKSIEKLLRFNLWCRSVDSNDSIHEMFVFDLLFFAISDNIVKYLNMCVCVCVYGEFVMSISFVLICVLCGGCICSYISCIMPQVNRISATMAQMCICTDVSTDAPKTEQINRFSVIFCDKRRTHSTTHQPEPPCTDISSAETNFRINIFLFLFSFRLFVSSVFFADCNT